MRSGHLIALTICLLAGALPARGENTADPVLRSYSKMMSLILLCGRACPLDVALARRYAAAFLEASQKLGVGKRAIDAEFERRAREIKITGTRPWCLSARASLREAGAGELFPDP